MSPLTPGNNCRLSLLRLCQLAPVRHHCKEQLQLGMLDPLGYQALGAVLPLDLLPPTDKHCTHLLTCKPKDTMHPCQSKAAAAATKLQYCNMASSHACRSLHSIMAFVLSLCLVAEARPATKMHMSLLNEHLAVTCITTVHGGTAAAVTEAIVTCMYVTSTA